MMGRTTADRLFQFSQNDGQADSATKEALRYSHALLEGFRTLADHSLNTRTAEDVCSKIKGTTMIVRRVPGTTLANDRRGEVIYTPPMGEKRLPDVAHPESPGLAVERAAPWIAHAVSPDLGLGFGVPDKWVVRRHLVAACR